MLMASDFLLLLVYKVNWLCISTLLTIIQHLNMSVTGPQTPITEWELSTVFAMSTFHHKLLLKTKTPICLLPVLGSKHTGVIIMSIDHQLNPFNYTEHILYSSKHRLPSA